MENQMQSYEMSDDQRRIYVDAAQLHEAYMDAFAKSRAYRGGMHWKKVKGKEYLFRSLDRYGYGKSLGPRSKETESIYDEFHNKKRQVQARLKQLKEKLKEQARYCKAARIARVPRVVTAIMRILEQHKLLGRNLQVVGTNAYTLTRPEPVFFWKGVCWRPKIWMCSGMSDPNFDFSQLTIWTPKGLSTFYRKRIAHSIYSAKRVIGQSIKPVTWST
jgi:hypothetical protein